ncbi:bel1 protein [Brown greater galago prosimian foamy virus]|uniref:Bel1 protein n=1 Tax=Brown greater galago prosimian foamy virus TaxID=2170139 RepID=A0A088FA16_9RETR|nr:bel1 protein [Brown greater galago prosimian foamy virus]AIM40344.1 bel1 protein [Brown greater galago prosimian foamy virus]
MASWNPGQKGINIPQNDESDLPQPRPLPALPASEFMDHNYVGMRQWYNDPSGGYPDLGNEELHDVLFSLAYNCLHFYKSLPIVRQRFKCYLEPSFQRVGIYNICFQCKQCYKVIIESKPVKYDPEVKFFTLLLSNFQKSSWRRSRMCRHLEWHENEQFSYRSTRPREQGSEPSPAATSSCSRMDSVPDPPRGPRECLQGPSMSDCASPIPGPCTSQEPYADVDAFLEGLLQQPQKGRADSGMGLDPGAGWTEDLERFILGDDNSCARDWTDSMHSDS